MENFTWIDLTMASVTLISVIVTVIVLCKSEKSTREILSEKHNTRCLEHANIIDKVEEKAVFLEKGNDILKEQQSRIENVVNYLKEENIKMSVDKEYMSKQTLDIVQTSKHISALTEMLVKQEQIINTLKNECETLKRENAELRDRIYNLERDEDMEL